MKLGKKEMLLIKKNEKLRKNAKLVETKKNRIDNQSIKIETVKCSIVKGSPIKGSPIKELEIYNERIPILKIDDNSFDESKQAELKIIINNDYNDENENDNLEEMFSNIDQKVKEKLKNLKIDLNKSTDLEKLRIKLSSVFEFSNQSKYEKVKWSKNEKINFLKFIITLINLEYKGYNYEINPDNDYFKRNGKMIPTILNNEDAAIKKCEEIFDSIEIGGEYEHSVVFHLKYISKKIQIEFKGDYLLYLKSKNLNMESYMKEGEFYEKFKDDFFKDLSMIKKLADCIKETEGNNLGIIFSQNLIDTLINCEDVYNSTDHEFLIDYKYSDIIKMMNNIESVLPIKLMYEYIEPNSVSNHGKISFYKVIDILNTKFSLNEEEKKSFLAYFSCFNILFDLFKLTSFLQVNSSSSMTELEIIIFKIKNSISQSNTLISNSFFKKYNLDQFKPFNISELLLIIPSIFKISKYETIIIFQYINNDPLNLNRNMKINLDLIFQILGIYEVFVTNPKKVKLDNYIMHSLKILYELIQGNQENFFRKYDKDNDSVLSREEFMLLLKECDSQLKLKSLG